MSSSYSNLGNFEIISKLGEGAYSIVYKVRRITDSQIYALKKVRLEPLKAKERENALNEVRILASIFDPYIINYKEAFLDEPSLSLCIVMEYAPGGDLQQKIKSTKSEQTNIAETEVWRFIIHICRGLNTLHKMQILHRDLKSANVFLTFPNPNGSAAPVYKLGDLNVSKIATRGLVYTQTGTPYYASPEVWRDEPYDLKSDIWSLGCVSYEMTSGKPPFQAPDMASLFKKVQKGTFERIPLNYSQELMEVIAACLKVNPTQRPTAAEILALNSVQKRIQNLNEGIMRKNSKCNLLKEIDVPKNLLFLKGKLPSPNYEKEDQENEKRAHSLDSQRSEKIEKKKNQVVGGRIMLSKRQDQKESESPIVAQKSHSQAPLKRNKDYSPTNHLHKNTKTIITNNNNLYNNINNPIAMPVNQQKKKPIFTMKSPQNIKKELLKEVNSPKSPKNTLILRPNSPKTSINLPTKLPEIKTNNGSQNKYESPMNTGNLKQNSQILKIKDDLNRPNSPKSDASSDSMKRTQMIKRPSLKNLQKNIKINLNSGNSIKIQNHSPTFQKPRPFSQGMVPANLASPSSYRIMLKSRPTSRNNEEPLQNADSTTNNRGFNTSQTNQNKILQTAKRDSKDNDYLKKVLSNEKEKYFRDNATRITNSKINDIKNIVSAQLNQDPLNMEKSNQMMQNTIKGKGIMMSPQTRIAMIGNKEKNMSLLNLISPQKSTNILNNRGLLYSNKPASAPYSNRLLISRQNE